ncbi:MAG: hypothetical protein GQ527_12830, partial [Bacteroidales bacterium]|nr:hypothetical protein [Bacteroidales bacterium]
EGEVLMNNSLYHTQRILVASGNIPSLNTADRHDVLKGNSDLPPIYSDLYKLATRIHEDEFLEALIDQIYIDKNNQVQLTPKVGVKNIYFGDLTQIEEKLFKLKTFYIDGKNIVDWQKYKSVNLKYRNQIVCSKK